MSLIPRVYLPPLGLPLNWRCEVSGVLPAAIDAYLSNRVNGAPLTQDQLSLVIDYFRHYIDAPCWEQEAFESELIQLRAEVRSLSTPDEISSWIGRCLEIGLDPI